MALDYPAHRSRQADKHHIMERHAPLSRLLLFPAIMVLLLASVSVAHAQTPPTPTVSTISVTSNPGTDNTYATGDKIEVTVTFSEAVTVSTTDGTPRLGIDIGGQPRNIPYDRAGSSTGQLIFSYTVFAGDMDADGIAVKADGLALNGGTIKSTDDSTDADLDLSAQTFATHKVDTEVVLVSNIGQADATETITISATESVETTLRVPATDNGHDLTGIVLDVKTASDTLDVTVNVALEAIFQNNVRNEAESQRLAARATQYTFSGSAGSAGQQAFTLDDPYFRRAGLIFGNTPNDASSFEFLVTISGSGEGTVEIGATTSSAEDTGGQSNFSIDNPASGDTVPQISLVGHAAVVPFIYHAEVLSKPHDGNTYKAGDRIDLQFVVPRYVDETNIPQEATFWLGSGAEHRRSARYVGSPLVNTDVHSLIYSYEVQSGDNDTDGILVGENPLGRNANYDTVDYFSRTPVDLHMPAMQLGANQGVDGSQASSCQDIQCNAVTVETWRRETRLLVLHRNEFIIGTLTGAFSIPGPASITPFEQSGSFSVSPTFRYGDAVYFVEQIGWSDGRFIRLGVPPEEIDTLVYAVVPAISEGNLSRLALTIDEQVFALRDSDHLSVYGETAFQWDAPDLNWMDGDVLQVKLIELPVTATFDAAAYGSDEGGSVEVTVTLGDTFEKKTVTLPLAVTGVGGATSADFSGVPSELVFAPGETSKTFTVELTDDAVDDDDESVTLSFGTLLSAVKEGRRPPDGHGRHPGRRRPGGGR